MDKDKLNNIAEPELNEDTTNEILNSFDFNENGIQFDKSLGNNRYVSKFNKEFKRVLYNLRMNKPDADEAELLKSAAKIAMHNLL